MAIKYNKDRAYKVLGYYTSNNRDVSSTMKEFNLSEQAIKVILRTVVMPEKKVKELYVDKHYKTKDIVNYVDDPFIFKDTRQLNTYILRNTNVRKPEKHAESQYIPEEIKEKIYKYYKSFGLGETYKKYTYPNSIILKCLRDYIVPKEKLVHYYTELDMTRRDILSIIGDSDLFPNEKSLKGHLERNKIKRKDSGKSSHKHVLQRAKEEYGVDDYSKLEYVKKKTKDTNIKRYGVPSNLQVSEVKEKIAKLKLKNVKWNENTSIFESKDVASSVLKDDEKLQNLIDDLFNKKEKDITLSDVSNVLGFSYNYTCQVMLGAVSSRKFNHLKRTLRGSEEEVGKYLDSLGVIYQHNARPDFMLSESGSRLELDYYIPDKNLAIEFNGTYWHSEQYGKSKNYHEIKTELCRNAGVRLLHIWEYDWNQPNKREVLKSQIAYMLHLDTIISYNARSLTVAEVPYKEANEFLDISHIQGGNVNGKVRYGLYDGNELISLMIVGKKRFSTNDSNVYELQRFTNKLYTNVRGGASRLFKYIINNNPNIGYVESFANNDFAQGTGKSVYSVLGFTYTGTSVSRYMWVRGQEVVSRHSVQTPKLLSYTNGNLNEPFTGATKDFIKGVDTERSYMERNGFYRVWNSGNDKYIKYIKR